MAGRRKTRGGSRESEREDLVCWARGGEGRGATAVEAGWDGGERERARLTHGTQTRRRDQSRRRGTGRSSPYRVFGGPTSLEAGSQGGGDSPKCGFLFRVGLCSTTLSILK